MQPNQRPQLYFSAIICAYTLRSGMDPTKYISTLPGSYFTHRDLTRPLPYISHTRSCCSGKREINEMKCLMCCVFLFRRTEVGEHKNTCHVIRRYVQEASKVCLLGIVADYENWHGLRNGKRLRVWLKERERGGKVHSIVPRHFCQDH